MHEVKILHLFCGSGLGALGFQLARGEHRGVTGVFQCIGGIDNDPLCCQDFEYLTGAPAHCIDLFDRQQYIDFNGCEPPADWSEIKGADLCRLFPKPPDVIFLSPPCKGFSGLLSEKASKSVKYQALNRLLIRAMRLVMDAWGTSAPPAFILIENVPRMKTRGAAVLTEVKALLGMYGYLFHEQMHECGEMGGLGQRRKRFLLVARNPKKAPSFLYQPPKQRIKSIGEIIGSLQVPGDIDHGGPLHRLPKLQWKTWVRLAIIPAGGDWRDLNRKCFSNIYRVVPYGDPSAAVTGGERPNNGALSIADPRLRYSGRDGTFRLVDWDEASPAVTGHCGPGRSNCISGVADPRRYYHGAYKVTPYSKAAGAVTSGHGPTCSGGATTVADPRYICRPRADVLGVMSYSEPAKTVIGSSDVHSGACAVADPRIPRETESGVWVIIAEDGTWHRPLTTLELAALQGLPMIWHGAPLKLAGSSEAVWREHIGNGVPVQTACAIGEAILATLLPNMMGDWHWDVDGNTVWVQGRRELTPMQAGQQGGGRQRKALYRKGEYAQMEQVKRRRLTKTERQPIMKDRK